MTNLKCSVHDCAYHAQDCCCKPEIDVGGCNSCDSRETSCESYAPKTDENAAEYQQPNEKLEVSCSANECIYNTDDKCGAKNVSINSMNGSAGCSTFIKK